MVTLAQQRVACESLPLGCFFWWKWVWQALSLLTHFPFPSISQQEGAVHSSAFLKLGDVMWLALSNKTWVEKMSVTSGWKYLRTCMCISPYFLPHTMTLAMSQMVETLSPWVPELGWHGTKPPTNPQSHAVCGINYCSFKPLQSGWLWLLQHNQSILMDTENKAKTLLRVYGSNMVLMMLLWKIFYIIITIIKLLYVSWYDVERRNN